VLSIARRNRTTTDWMPLSRDSIFTAVLEPTGHNRKDGGGHRSLKNKNNHMKHTGRGASVSSFCCPKRAATPLFAQAEKIHNGPTLDGAVAFFGEPWGSSPSGSLSRDRVAMALQERTSLCSCPPAFRDPGRLPSLWGDF